MPSCHSFKSLILRNITRLRNRYSQVQSGSRHRPVEVGKPSLSLSLTMLTAGSFSSSSLFCAARCTPFSGDVRISTHHKKPMFLNMPRARGCPFTSSSAAHPPPLLHQPPAYYPPRRTSPYLSLSLSVYRLILSSPPTPRAFPGPRLILHAEFLLMGLRL
jgi:hypothetical protein